METMQLKYDVVHISRGGLGYFGVAQQGEAYKALGAKPTLRALLESSLAADMDDRVQTALRTIKLKAEELNWDDRKIEQAFMVDGIRPLRGVGSRSPQPK